MKTNDIFNFGRFGKYLVSDLKTCAANYGLSLLTLAVITPLVVECFAGLFSLLLGTSWNGTGLGFRACIFAIAMFCIMVTMPSKCYGRLTEKQYGSLWLMLPSSRLEKFISMLLICCIITPVISICMYMGMDALICAIDNTCGENMIASAFKLIDGFASFKMTLGEVDMEIAQENIRAIENGHKFIDTITNPWLYVDEVLCMSLPFLLGAICFKKGKIVKTFLAMTALSIAISMLGTPLMMTYMGDLMAAANEEEAMTMLFESGFYNRLIWVDIVGDFILFGGIIAAIWFRIKTLKH